MRIQRFHEIFLDGDVDQAVCEGEGWTRRRIYQEALALLANPLDEYDYLTYDIGRGPQLLVCLALGSMAGLPVFLTNNGDSHEGRKSMFEGDRECVFATLTPGISQNPEFRNNPILAYMFTGGTTGKSKCVPLTHAMFIHEYHMYPEIVPPLKARPHFLQSSCVVWTASCLGQLSIALALKLPLVFGENIRTPADLGLFLREHEEVGVIGVVPFMLDDLSPTVNLELIFTWGEVLKVGTCQAFLENGVGVVNLLTATEYWLTLYSVHTPQHPNIGNGFSQCPHTSLKLVEGQLHVGGPQVFDGYLLSPAARQIQSRAKSSRTPGFKQIEGQSFFSTDDRMVEENGRYFFRGRTATSVKILGKFVDLHELEAQVLELPFVHECVVLSPDFSSRRSWTLAGAALFDQVNLVYFVVLKEFHADSLPKLRQCIPSMGKLFLLEEMPKKVETLKIDRPKLQQWCNEGLTFTHAVDSLDEYEDRRRASVFKLFWGYYWDALSLPLWAAILKKLAPAIPNSWLVSNTVGQVLYLPYVFHGLMWTRLPYVLGMALTNSLPYAWHARNTPKSSGKSNNLAKYGYLHAGLVGASLVTGIVKLLYNKRSVWTFPWLCWLSVGRLRIRDQWRIKWRWNQGWRTLKYQSWRLTQTALNLPSATLEFLFPSKKADPFDQDWDNWGMDGPGEEPSFELDGEEENHYSWEFSMYMTPAREKDLIRHWWDYWSEDILEFDEGSHAGYRKMVDYKEIQEMMRDETPAASPSPFHTLVAETLSLPSCGPQTSLGGIPSILLLGLVTKLEKTYAKVVSFNDVARCQNVEELEALVEQGRPSTQQMLNLTSPLTRSERTRFKCYYSPPQWISTCRWLLEYEGTLDYHQTRLATELLVLRHPGLRSFPMSEHLNGLQRDRGTAVQLTWLRHWLYTLKSSPSTMVQAFVKVTEAWLNLGFALLNYSFSRCEVKPIYGHPSPFSEDWFHFDRVENDYMSLIRSVQDISHPPLYVHACVINRGPEGKPVSHVWIQVCHAHSDGQSTLALLEDFSKFYKGAGLYLRKGGMHHPIKPILDQTTWFPDWNEQLYSELVALSDLSPEILDCSKIRENRVSRTLRGDIFPTAISWRGKFGYNRYTGYLQKIQWRKSSEEILGFVSEKLGISSEVLMLAITVIAVARTEKRDKVPCTLFAPIRDDVAETGCITLFSDWRDILFNLGPNLTTVGCVESISQSLRSRHWVPYDPHGEDETLLLNILPRTKVRSHGWHERGEMNWRRTAAPRTKGAAFEDPQYNHREKYAASRILGGQAGPKATRYTDLLYTEGQTIEKRGVCGERNWQKVISRNISITCEEHDHWMTSITLDWKLHRIRWSQSYFWHTKNILCTLLDDVLA